MITYKNNLTRYQATEEEDWVEWIRETEPDFQIEDLDEPGAETKQG